ncbi:MAG: alpha/beta hydrolase [Leptolyngbya sp. SIO1E4]|nr:alpha/beta hydrolase [Leptolyngbya sp. SIO1E4]
MSDTPDGLWLCANPHLRRFDQRLFERLNLQADVRCWNYSQTADESCCLETVLVLLHDYIQQQSHPIHLIGHSLSGTIALLYARQYPERVKSLTLLSVGANPAVSWHAHYYALRELLPCNRKIVLNQMARLLFGPQSPVKAAAIVKLLAQVLDTEIAPHSLAHRNALSTGGIEPPLLVCNGAHDVILDPNTQMQWHQWLKSGDRLWMCPQGRHFFHHEYPQRCSQLILEFWHQAACQSGLPLVELAP